MPSEQAVQSPVQYIKGVGPSRAALLAQMGIHTATDLLFYLPRGHQDRRLHSIRDARSGLKMAFKAKIQNSSYRRLGPMLGQMRAHLEDGTGSIEAIWFKHLTYKYDVFSGVKKNIVAGQEGFFFGTVEIGRNGVEFRVEEYDILSSAAADLTLWNTIVPLYSVSEGLSERWLRQIMARVIPQEVQSITDYLPKKLLETHSLVPLPWALRSYHFPFTWEDRDRARQRLAFDEFFFLELALELSRRDRTQHTKGFSSVPTKKLLTPFKHHLGFDFTRAQIRTLNEIFRDMAGSMPMYRLLQGDVGSGKTCVALSAALLTIENGRQTALLAPTEILAEQHLLTMNRFLEGLPIRMALLTRSTSTKDRGKILKDLKSGKLNLLLGTHAILNEEVEFKQLGLVVVDEQHRFGVRQRAKIIQKATHSQAFEEGRLIEKTHPDVLVMTATPIPRTLALTLYGDLDVSLLDEMPKGRAAVQSRMVGESVAIEEIRKSVQLGHQVYVVLPLIEESQILSRRVGREVKSAKKEFERLQGILAPFHLGLLHGRMKRDEKNRIMAEFRQKKISILVATPVIEVGIDIPNATLMVIMNPERFGLAQLHQLRGRVGRGPWPSQCLLVPSLELEGTSQSRLDVFVSLSDGFKLAEEDLRLRGPGEILGEAQHGVPLFRVGDLVSDGLLIAEARNGARSLVRGDLQLSMGEFRLLNFVLQKRYGDKLNLTYVG